MGKIVKRFPFTFFTVLEFRDIFLRKRLPLKFGLTFHLTHGLWEKEENDHSISAKMNTKHWPKFGLGSKIPFPARITFIFCSHKMI